MKKSMLDFQYRLSNRLFSARVPKDGSWVSPEPVQ